MINESRSVPCGSHSSGHSHGWTSNNTGESEILRSYHTILVAQGLSGCRARGRGRCIAGQSLKPTWNSSAAILSMILNSNATSPSGRGLSPQTRVFAVVVLCPTPWQFPYSRECVHRDAFSSSFRQNDRPLVLEEEEEEEGDNSPDTGGRWCR